MNTLDIGVEMPFALGSETRIHLPSGLLGFEGAKKYIVSSNIGEEPFYWLQVENEPTLSFLLVSPFEVLPDYQPDIPADDVQYLGLETPDDAILLNIVTLRPGGDSSVNLKGPIVINRFSMIGKQVVLANAAAYSVQHPLAVLE